MSLIIATNACLLGGRRGLAVVTRRQRSGPTLERAYLDAPRLNLAHLK